MKTIHIDVEPKEITLEMGYNTIILDKLYGPLIFCNLKVWSDSKTCEWVVEREIIDKNGNISWEEIIRIDGQESIDFTEP